MEKFEGRVIPDAENLENQTTLSIREVLTAAGLVGNGDRIEQDDYDAIARRASILLEGNDELTEEVVLPFAYVERMMATGRFSDVTENLPDEFLKEYMKTRTGETYTDEEVELFRRYAGNLQNNMHVADPVNTWREARKRAMPEELHVAIDAKDSVIAQGNSAVEAAQKAAGENN